MTHFDADFETIYRHYVGYLRSFAFRRIDSDSAEDVVSEAFAVAWTRRDSAPDDALPWLYAIARNVIGTRYRADERWRLLAEKLRSVPSESPVGPADETVQRAQFVNAMARLSDDDRELLLLVAWEGLTPAEIAEVVGANANAVSVRIHRARTRLRTLLANEDAPVEDR